MCAQRVTGDVFALSIGTTILAAVSQPLSNVQYLTKEKRERKITGRCFLGTMVALSKDIHFRTDFDFFPLSRAAISTLLLYCRSPLKLQDLHSFFPRRLNYVSVLYTQLLCIIHFHSRG